MDELREMALTRLQDRLDWLEERMYCADTAELRAEWRDEAARLAAEREEVRAGNTAAICRVLARRLPERATSRELPSRRYERSQEGEDRC